MKKLRRFGFFLGILSSGLMRGQAVTIVTENVYPMQIEKNGKVAGTATELVEAVMGQAGLTYEIHMWPWARAYKSASEEPNVLIYSIARTAEREAMFKWVGIVLPVDYKLYRLKKRQDIQPKTLTDLKKFSVGVINQDVVHKYLEGKGHRQFLPVPKTQQKFQMLARERVDLISYNAGTVKFACKDASVDCDQIEPAISLDEISTALYMAFSKNTDDAIVQKANSAYQKIRQDGIYDKIMGRTLRGEE